MTTAGYLLLVAAFSLSVLAAISLLCSGVFGFAVRVDGRPSVPTVLKAVGRVSSLFAFAVLAVACALLVWCFASGDNSLRYVVEYRSDAEGVLGWLYRLSGLWAGREGSLLLWAFLHAAFAGSIALRRKGRFGLLDAVALAVMELLLGLFSGTLLFSEDNMPFKPMPAEYLSDTGELVGSAASWGMNPLLEHWAMAAHPPTLFMGYAGLAVPFSYAVAALVRGDLSGDWAARCRRATLVAWLFLGLGIAIGGVWAYVVLGWGGYWGWDAVENASLLPWLAGAALLHSFDALFRRRMFARWTIACACVAYSFVALAAFITRSGIIGSVHAFAGDSVSSVLFAALVAVPLVAGGIGLLFRWKDLAPNASDGHLSAFVSRDAAYCLNNFFLVFAAVAIAYVTLAPALPEFLPLAGRTFGSDAFSAVARPLGLLYFALAALCPLLSWGKTDGRRVLRCLRIPGACSLVLFAGLVAYHVLRIAPGLEAAVESDPDMASGPLWYLNALAVAGYLIASALLVSSLGMLCPSFLGHGACARLRVGSLGSALAHAGMAVMLAGLVGSSMFVNQQAIYLERPSSDSGMGSSAAIGDYLLVLEGDSIDVAHDGSEVANTALLKVYRGDHLVGEADPSILITAVTGQQQYRACVLGSPLEDLFIVYRGTAPDGACVFDVRINPLIRCVWAGAALLLLGTGVAAFPVTAARRPNLPGIQGQINKTQ